MPVTRADAKTRRQQIEAIILMIAGFSLLLFTILSTVQQGRTTADYISTQGQVVGHQEVAGRDRQDSPITRYADIVEYQAGGKKYRVTSTQTTTNPSAIGRVLEVKYDPLNPGQSVLPGAEFQSKIVFLVASSVILLLGLFLLVKPVKTRIR